MSFSTNPGGTVYRMPTTHVTHTTPWRVTSGAPKPHQPGGTRVTWPPPKDEEELHSSQMTSHPVPASGMMSGPPPRNLNWQPQHQPVGMGGGPGGTSGRSTVWPPPPQPASPPPPAVRQTWAPAPPQAGFSPGRGIGGQQQTAAARRGRGTMNPAATGTMRVPTCDICRTIIRGPFVTAMNKCWCPEHFTCANAQCRVPLHDKGFVEENGQLYCERDYEQFFAPKCGKCQGAILGDILNAMSRQFHPECFVCTHCRRPFGNSSFYLEDANPYCEKDWNELFTTKCVSCGFAIEAGDRWVEALSQNYHSQCFKCTVCHKNLEGQSFFAKAGRPYCRAHAR